MNDVAVAYAELDEILSLMSSEYIDKIPLKFRDFLSREKDTNYIKKIDVNKPLEEQNLQRKTLVLLAVLRLNYWCENEKEKQEFLNELNNNEKEQLERFNTDNLFSNNQKETKTEDSQLIEYKEKNVIQKIIEKIKNIFRRK
ncbi:MAG: hypothetical protein K6B70_00395 [Clostridia bacterium]|nr:hypothetical protein [Clostridia bacterium]